MKSDAKLLCSLILKTRRIQKMIGTYYQRLSEQTYEDGCIRPYFHHVVTVTGRLTSDIQQVPKANVSKVKQIYSTRYK